MRQLDGNFTQKFNKRHNRVGPLFQGRYKATLIDRDNYSLEVSKYIHLNPVKAKMVDKPEQYKWSSYSAFIGKNTTPDFLTKGWLLGQFHKSQKRAIKEFKIFTSQPLGKDWSPEKEAYKGIILGSSSFISQIQDTYLSGKSDPEIPQLKVAKKQRTPEDIEEMVNKLKLNSKVRDKFLIYSLKKYSQLTLKEIGERMAGLHYSSISQIVRRLQNEVKTNKHLKQIILKVDNGFKM